jgi:hypothetical protein
VLLDATPATLSSHGACWAAVERRIRFGNLHLQGGDRGRTVFEPDDLPAIPDRVRLACETAPEDAGKAALDDNGQCMKAAVMTSRSR